MKEEKIKYGNLSVPLKIGIVAAWALGIIYMLFFITGMLSGAIL